MAKVTLTLTVKTSWWVQPYICLAIAAAWTVRPFASDEQIDAWSTAHAAFIVAHGMKFGSK